jgi:hypothetical protein
MMTIPGSVQQIGELCFAWCSRLDDLAFEKESKLQRIEESAFGGSGLRRIVLPNAHEFMAGSALRETHVYYVAKERREAVYAVSGSFLHHMLDKTLVRCCGSHNEVIIPNLVESIGGSCFEMIEALEAV